MIKGLTDKFVIRRAGKVRAGHKDEGSNSLHNPKNFLLHDAPQLIPILGESPTEIYFTVNSDDLEAVAPADLRWYTKTELMCLGDAVSAAYFGNGEVAGVTQQPHERIAKSRVRRCLHRLCPEYQAGNCTEHIFLNLVVPQYSMASYFTLDSTSINAVLNITGALQSTAVYGGPQGQIFRLYKKEIPMAFQNPKTGQKSKSKRPVVHVDFVPFEQYEAMFRDKIATHDWAALMALRSRQVRFVVDTPELSGAEAPRELTAQSSRPALTAPESTALSDEEVVRARANDPLVVPLFEELAALRGKPNTEEARINTAKMVPNVQTLVDWLKKTIAADKKKRTASTVVSAHAASVEEATVDAVQAASVIAASGSPIDPLAGTAASREVTAGLF